MTDPRSILGLSLTLLLSTLCQSASAQDCPAKLGDCLESHGGPGCTDPTCCTLICGLDPICCVEWDAACANQADLLCSALCGATAAGNCFIANPTPSCSIASCCESICLIDSFCCETAWDTNCALMASFSCESKGGGGRCGDPDSGDCTDANGLPACNDEACCESVCTIDPGCCDSAWDLLCVGLADTLCGFCQINPPPGTPEEAEACSVESNDPCQGGTMQSIACGASVAGRFRNATDVDTYQFELTDTDGDGWVRIKLTLATSVPANVQVTEDTCDAPEIWMDLAGQSCIGYVQIACVPAGNLRLRLAASGAPPSCTDVFHYLLSVECLDYCAEPCANPEDCLLPHLSPGCSSPECCETVCEKMPACCDWVWDSSCATAAAKLCGGPPPINDLCIDAIDAGIGLTTFRQALSTLDPLPETECVDDATITTGDVWFQHTVSCEGNLLIGTCSTIDFNSILEVYRGECDSLEFVVCSEESPACNFGSSIVEVPDPVCGETLLIRVCGAGDSSGTGALLITCLGGDCPCTEDLDGDGVVGGADLGLFLSDWGKGASPADFNDDGVVSGPDLGLLLAAWGPC